MSGCEHIGPLLGGYHDGELGRLRRWRVGRHLERCPGCRSELAELGRVGPWVREALGTAPDPDVWAGLAARLPRPQVAAPLPRRRLAPFAAPLAAAALVSAVLLLGDDSLLPPPEGAQGSVVRSINAHGRPVLVLDGASDATIIWLMDEAGSESPEEARSVWI